MFCVLQDSLKEFSSLLFFNILIESPSEAFSLYAVCLTQQIRGVLFKELVAKTW